jgi:hypothetical protein
MKTKSKADITIETHRSLTIRTNRRLRMEGCSECLERTRRLTPDEAAIWASVGVRVINKQVENRALHFIEMPGGEVLICLNSLLDVL